MRSQYAPIQYHSRILRSRCCHDCILSYFISERAMFLYFLPIDSYVLVVSIALLDTVVPFYFLLAISLIQIPYCDR